MTFLYFSMDSKYYNLIKQHISFLHNSFLSVRISNSLWGKDVLLFSEFISIVSILFYNSTEFIILLYTFLVNFCSLSKGYIICLVSFSKFAEVSPAFYCARAIDNLWSICLWPNIFNSFPRFALYLASDTILE